MRLHIEALAQNLATEEQRLLQAVSGSELEQALAIANLIRTGARVRWGLYGWFVEDCGVKVPSTILANLARASLIESDEGVVVWGGRRPDFREQRRDLVENLLCDHWADNLDAMSRYMFRHHQRRAFFAKISELSSLYNALQEQAEIANYREAIITAVRAQWALAGLRFCGLLQMLGIGPNYRVKLARKFLQAMKEVIPGSFH